MAWLVAGAAVGDAGAAGAAGAGGGRLYSISVDADMSRARGVSMGYMSRARGVRRATGDARGVARVPSSKFNARQNNVSTNRLVLPQRFDWTKGFCTLGVVASLCATAPTSPTAVRSRLGSTDSWLLARSLAPYKTKPGADTSRASCARCRRSVAAAPRVHRASDRRC